MQRPTWTAARKPGWPMTKANSLSFSRKRDKRADVQNKDRSAAWDATGVTVGLQVHSPTHVLQHVQLTDVYRRAGLRRD